MGFKDIIEKMQEKQQAKKDYLKKVEDQMRFNKIAEDRLKSSNERELERFEKEEREEQIKQALEYHRKKREQDIRFGHNPLDTPNITNHTDWEVMKEKNMFKNNGCMFANQPSVIKSNKNLLKNNKKLNSLKGGMFKI